MKQSEVRSHNYGFVTPGSMIALNRLNDSVDSESNHFVFIKSSPQDDKDEKIPNMLSVIEAPMHGFLSQNNICNRRFKNNDFKIETYL
jgi:hypothetical protein